MRRQVGTAERPRELHASWHVYAVESDHGPALDAIAARMTEDQMTRQVLQGGGNMPAYGNSLDPSETTAPVRFLTTLRGKSSIARY
jgi:hypothetical protein